LLTVPEGDQLVGDIAHEMFRRLFQKRLPQDQIVRQTESIFDELVDSVGLPLLLNGQNTDKDNAKRLLVSAAQQFSRMLADAELEVIDCESHKERAFGKGMFIGDIDILLKDRAGNPIVIDYKWSKGVKYRLEEIQKSQHLQLAAYAWLEASGSGEFAHVGYYMLRQRRLIHCGEHYLKIGQQVASLPLSEVWRRAEAMYQASTGTLQRGVVCAAGVPDTDPSTTTASSLLALEPPCKFCNYGNICGARGMIDA